MPLYQFTFTLQECRAEHNIPQPLGQLAQLVKALSSHTQIIVIFKCSQVPGQKHKHVCMRGEPRFIHSSSCLPCALGGSQAFPSAPRCMWAVINRGIKWLYLYLQSSASILHCGQKCTQYPLSIKLSISTQPQRALKSNDCFLESPFISYISLQALSQRGWLRDQPSLITHQGNALWRQKSVIKTRVIMCTSAGIHDNSHDTVIFCVFVFVFVCSEKQCQDKRRLDTVRHYLSEHVCMCYQSAVCVYWLGGLQRC